MSFTKCYRASNGSILSTDSYQNEKMIYMLAFQDVILYIIFDSKKIKRIKRNTSV